MADMRRRSPEPPPGPPQIQLTPGLGEQTMRELAPLLAEDGIDVVLWIVGHRPNDRDSLGSAARAWATDVYVCSASRSRGERINAGETTTALADLPGGPLTPWTGSHQLDPRRRPPSPRREAEI
jgi:hypothetical protein